MNPAIGFANRPTPTHPAIGFANRTHRTDFPDFGNRLLIQTDPLPTPAAASMHLAQLAGSRKSARKNPEKCITGPKAGATHEPLR